MDFSPHDKKFNIFSGFKNIYKFRFVRFGLYLFCGVVLFVGIYFIASPFYLEVEYYFNKTFYPEKFTSQYYFSEKQFTKSDSNVYSSTSSNSSASVNEDVPEKKAQEEIVKNKTYYKDLVMPSIGLDVRILEGDSESNLEQGSWLKPIGKKPGQSGNSIIAGHRYQYFQGVRPFYNLDKVAKGDQMYVIWEGEKITYTVEDKFLVNPTDVWIQDQREGNYLTIYTCEGLKAEKRLVVLAKQV
ncbi:MAG: sortase [bacterium]